MAEPTDDRELERLMKEGLERRAAAADTTGAAELVASARKESASRPWRTAGVMGLAAACAAGIVFATVALQGDDEIRSGGRNDVVDGASEAPVTGWRTEYWRDTKVDVPADWGWGGAPMPDIVDPESGRNGEPIDCGAMAYVGPDGERFLNGDRTVPYVGRPLMMTDACGGSFGPGNWPEPAAPYVWLGAPVEQGTVEFTNGYVMETVEVNGSTVSVATKDPALRREILATAGGGETCMSEYDGVPAISVVPREGVREPTGMTVCAYQEDAGQARLTYVTHVGAEATRSFKQALDRAPVADCTPKQGNEWVVLSLEGAEGVRQEYLVQLGECSGIQVLPGGGLIELNEETVSRWAVDGVPAYVAGPYGGKGATGQFFRGMLG